ncbi:MAG: hypothetical protein ACOVN9_05665 [Inhella sp.]
MNSLPVLTEVVTPLPAHGPLPPAPQEWLVQALPGLLQQAVADLQPQLEQQLLDALMPRLLASLAQWEAEKGGAVVNAAAKRFGPSRLP